MKLFSEKGQALTELALVLPLLALMLMPTIDFGRALYFASTLTHAVRSGAQFGSINMLNVVDSAGMTSATTSAGASIGLASGEVAADGYWRCSNESTSTQTPLPVPDDACPGNYIFVNARVTATKNFTTIFTYPWIDSIWPMTRTAQLRVG